MGCHHMYSEIQGSGKRELQKREVSPFTSITTQGAFDIEVICQIDLIEVRTRIHPCSRNTRLPCQPQERTRPRPQKKLDSTPTPYPGNHENRAAAQQFALWPRRVCSANVCSHSCVANAPCSPLVFPPSSPPATT